MFAEMIGTPEARVVLGGRFGEVPYHHCAALLDRFVDRGGVAIDTAHAYASGESERSIGRWMRARRCRDRVIIFDKACHPASSGAPGVTPATIHRDLADSLHRLGTDYIDLYLLHRDDRSMPVDVLVDALETERNAGRVRAYGASNWHVDRLQAAALAATASGAQGFAAVSSQFSLARPIRPLWPGTVVLDDDLFGWHERTAVPLVAWSAQARGWFASNTSPAQVEATWDCPANQARRERASELGRYLGLSATAVALAFVLARRPFPVFPVIGPDSVFELDDSLAACGVELLGEELRHLDLDLNLGSEEGLRDTDAATA